MHAAMPLDLSMRLSEFHSFECMMQFIASIVYVCVLIAPSFILQFRYRIPSTVPRRLRTREEEPAAATITGVAPRLPDARCFFLITRNVHDQVHLRRLLRLGGVDAKRALQWAHAVRIACILFICGFLHGYQVVD